MYFSIFVHARWDVLSQEDAWWQMRQLEFYFYSDGNRQRKKEKDEVCVILMRSIVKGRMKNEE